MSNIPAILIANGAAVALLSVVLFSAWKTVRFGMFDHKLFLSALVFSLVQSVTESATFLIDGRPGLEWLNLAVNVVLYIDNITFAFVWTLYIDYKLFADVDRLKRVYPLVAIPALLVAAGSLVNLFTPVFFRIAAGNVYQRTGAFVLSLAAVYLYLLYGVVLVYVNRNKVNKYLFLPVLIFVTPICISSLLQFHFYGYSLVGIGTAIGLTSVYINVQNETSFTDHLTGLFTRQYLMLYLNSQVKNREDGKDIVGILLDIDCFKQINDTFGHLTGDDALVKAGRILRESMPRKGIAARYAGDEFVLILQSEDRQAAEEVLGRIQAKTKAENASGQNPYTLSFSAGHSRFYSGDTVETFLRRIDAEMYENKKRSRELRRRSTDVPPGPQARIPTAAPR